MSPASPRVLFYSPYGQWHYHGVIETTLGHALALRGAQVSFTACDGLFPACDVYRQGINPRDASSCLNCQADTARMYADMKAPYAWAGRWLSPASRRQVWEWAAGLPDSGLLDAAWRGHPVGQWARSSAFYQFRLSRFELDDPAVRQGLREHVAGTALAVEFLVPLLEDSRPDVLVTLNGRFFSHWAAFELARARGIRIVTHERGLLKGTLRFSDNARIHDLGIYGDIWDRWKDIPLDAAEVQVLDRILGDRRAGRNMPWRAYSPPPQDEGEVRRHLQLGEGPVLALFTSSDDESAAFPERRQGAYPDPLEWLVASVGLADRFRQHTLVVRLHPNLTAAGVNRQTLEQARALAAAAPANVRFVWPDDDISSYTLADMAAAGLVYFTTLGLEMACRGQAVVTPARGLYGTFPFVTWGQTPAAYANAVAAAAVAGPSADTARLARRYAYHYYRELSVPFPQVIEEPRHQGQVTFADAGELAPGRSASLDRICSLILDGSSMLSAPGVTHGQRTAGAEDSWLTSAWGAGSRAAPAWLRSQLEGRS